MTNKAIQLNEYEAELIRCACKTAAERLEYLGARPNGAAMRGESTEAFIKDASLYRAIYERLGVKFPDAP